jgi:catechol 2,3-dioxygenase-like lactoylglutathione lyase family enzyme
MPGMETRIGHLQLNIQPSNLPFYKDLMAFLGWRVVYDDHGMLGVADTTGASLWFAGYAKPVGNDYDGPGMNHLAMLVAAQADVDAMVAYLKAHGVPPLFETPRHRPEFARGPDQTYYQVMFETPDRILLEVVYIGPR